MTEDEQAELLIRIDGTVQQLKKDWDIHYNYHFKPGLGLDARVTKLDKSVAVALGKAGLIATIISLIISGAVVMLFSGCAGSPKVTVNKSITIAVGNAPMVQGQICSVPITGVYPIWINVDYTTVSDLETKLDTKQDIKPKTTIPFKGM